MSRRCAERCVVAVIALALLKPGVLRAAQSGTTMQANQFVYDAKGKRDPVTPLGSRIQGPRGAGNASGQPALLGILWDPTGNSIALIDDLEVKAGDQVRDYLVQEIRKDSVVLRRGEEQLVLQIKFE